MSKKFKFAILALSVYLLSACGGGGSSSETIYEEPITPYTSFGSVIDQGIEILTASGADGDILMAFDELNEPDFILADGRASMNIDNVQRSETYSFSCPDGTSAQISFFEDYAGGIEEVSAIVNGQTIDCISTYPSGLVPTTIGSSASIYDLIVLSDVSDVGDYISTNCPSEESANNPFNQDLDPDPSICETGLFVDITVTDDDNITHLLSYESVSIPLLD